MNDPSIFAGLCALGGALIGAVGSYLATRAGHRWGEARKKIIMLCDQVAAYHRLEDLYVIKVQQLERTERKPQSIKISMRDEVERIHGFRPDMTESGANKIKKDWS